MTFPAPADPVLDFVFEIRCALGDAVEMGPVPRGRRRIVPILDGPVVGPRLRGRVLPGGADWQLVRPDGVAEVEAFYVIETDDGARIHVHNRGVRSGPPDVLARLASGEVVDPAAYYFRTVPTFEAPPGPHDWLNGGIYLCTGARYPNDIVLRMFRVG